MTTHQDHSDIHALEELGRRFDVAARARSAPARRSRRAVLVAAVATATLVGTPAVASIAGVSIPGVFNSHSNVEEALPRAAAVIDPADPAATGRALSGLGIDVRWTLVEDDPGGSSPTKGRTVSAPPPGTGILSVTAVEGAPEITADTRVLQIEVAPVGSKILNEHR
ncbi:MAG: hypothetical protein WKF96_25040 [Solirubrobacteraceae bacterium]